MTPFIQTLYLLFIFMLYTLFIWMMHDNGYADTMQYGFGQCIHYLCRGRMQQ